MGRDEGGRGEESASYAIGVRAEMFTQPCLRDENLDMSMKDFRVIINSFKDINFKCQ